MSIWEDIQKKPSGDIRKLLQDRLVEANPCRTEVAQRRVGADFKPHHQRGQRGARVVYDISSKPPATIEWE